MENFEPVTIVDLKQDQQKLVRGYSTLQQLSTMKAQSPSDLPQDNLQFIRVCIVEFFVENAWFFEFFGIYFVLFAAVTLTCCFPIFVIKRFKVYFAKKIPQKPDISVATITEKPCLLLTKQETFVEEDIDPILPLDVDFDEQEASIIKPKGGSSKVRRRSSTRRDSSAAQEIPSSAIKLPDTCTNCRDLIIPTKSNRRISSSDQTHHWHEACFKCEGCDRSLVRQGYYLRGSHVYCDKCMDDLFSDICERCDFKIKLYTKDERQISSVDGKQHWHDTCYTCVSCHMSLIGKGYYVSGNVGGMYCAKCYDDNEADICNRCNIRIYRCSANEKQIRSKDRTRNWHANCYNCYKCSINLVGKRHYAYVDGQLYCPVCYDQLTSKFCCKCNERIYRCSKQERQISSKEHENMQWHDRCYKCYKCAALLTGQGHYWHSDSQMYCGVCYDELTARRCARCEKQIFRYSLGQKQVASKDRSRYWHDTCYSCWKCYKALVGLRQYSFGDDGAMYCAGCFDNLTAQRCTNCKEPIYRYSKREKQVTIQDKDSEPKFYHDYCYQCSKCLKSLMIGSGTGHHPHADGNVYCDDCYDELTAPNCSKCKQRFSRMERQIASKDKRRFWHDFCFLCSRCRCSLVGEVSYCRTDSMYCQSCAKASGYMAGPTVREEPENSPNGKTLENE